MGLRSIVYFFRGLFINVRHPGVRYLDLDVVHFKGRPFPEATVPGDELWMMRWRVNRLVHRAKTLGDAAMMSDAVGLQQQINAVFEKYNSVCKRFGMGGWDAPDDTDIFGNPWRRTPPNTLLPTESSE